MSRIPHPVTPGPRDRPGALAVSALLALVLASGGCRGDAPPPEGERTAKGAAPSTDTIPLAERRTIAARIAYIAEGGGDAEVYLLGLDGGAPRRVTADPAQDYPAAASPDGRSLVVVSALERGGVHGERMRIFPLSSSAAPADTAPKPLDQPSTRVRSPAWAPDGTWLAFESAREAFREIYRAAADGTGARRLTDNREGNFEPAVSPDGSMIAFSSSRDGDTEIYVMRADGTEQRRLTAFHREDRSPAWSPDGRWIAFISDREGRDRIFLIAPDGTGTRRLGVSDDTTGGRAGELEGEIAWSPDGTRVAYAVRRSDRSSRIRVADARTGAWRDLDARPAGVDAAPAWSPDGRYLAFYSDRGGGDPDLWLMRADGSGATRLTRTPGADWLPRWVRGR